MTVFAVNNLSKQFDFDTLFESISFGIDFGERIGLIGKNGIGKTTLLKIIAGKDYPDTGEVVFNNKVRFEYLEQIPQFDSEEIIIEAVMSAKPEHFYLLDRHKVLCHKLNTKYDDTTATELQNVTAKIEFLNAWNLETEAKIILSKLGIEDFSQSVKTLSGGLKKRVALAKHLLSNPELLILDEPTNHLDADSVQWLQDRLMNSSNSLLFVTHDRYFLDAVSTRIIELDQKRIFSFPGNYLTYLERKDEMMSVQNSTVEHNRSKYRIELAWLERGAPARRTKQKSRIDWISQIKEETKKNEERKIKIEIGNTFTGKRIIDTFNISKSIAGKTLFKDFTYIAKRGDRIGIIGPNGCGKSTLLNVLSGLNEPDSGKVIIGESTTIGYYKQEITDLKPTQSVIGALREIADFIDCGVGKDRYISARELLSKFLFPHNQQSALISTLSGGEKRRLALLRMLISNPNIIFLDEPTNDLDIPTLNVLEEYLENFKGVLLVVSHDRAFLDRTVEFIKVFDEDGNIKEYPGNYTDYLVKKESETKLNIVAKPQSSNISKKSSNKTQKKLSYIEQREFDSLEIEIPKLEKEKILLEEKIHSGDCSDYKLLEDLSTQLVELQNQIDEKTFRWLELSDKF